jgi:hypothetical protein
LECKNLKIVFDKIILIEMLPRSIEILFEICEDPAKVFDKFELLGARRMGLERLLAGKTHEVVYTPASLGF